MRHMKELKSRFYLAGFSIRAARLGLKNSPTRSAVPKNPKFALKQAAVSPSYSRRIISTIYVFDILIPVLLI